MLRENRGLAHVGAVRPPAGQDWTKGRVTLLGRRRPSDAAISGARRQHGDRGCRAARPRRRRGPSDLHAAFMATRRSAILRTARIQTHLARLRSILSCGRRVGRVARSVLPGAHAAAGLRASAWLYGGGIRSSPRSSIRTMVPGKGTTTGGCHDDLGHRRRTARRRRLRSAQGTRREDRASSIPSRARTILKLRLGDKRLSTRARRRAQSRRPRRRRCAMPSRAHHRAYCGPDRRARAARDQPGAFDINVVGTQAT